MEMAAEAVTAPIVSVARLAMFSMDVELADLTATIVSVILLACRRWT
jgi:hypothetical protein